MSNVYVSGKKTYLTVFLPSRPSVVCEMLRLANVTDRDIVYDVGGGDGRIPIRAVQEPFNAKKAVGIEIHPSLVADALKNVSKLEPSLQRRIEILNRDVFDCSLEEADKVTAFLTPEANEMIRPKLERELKETSIVVSSAFEFEKWKPFSVKSIDVPDRGLYFSHLNLYAYKMDSIY